jgi:hypothetical protein
VTGRPVLVAVGSSTDLAGVRTSALRLLAAAGALLDSETEVVERDVLGRHLSSLGHRDLASVVRPHVGPDAWDREAFNAGFARSLTEGRFRLVLVLDEPVAEVLDLARLLGTVAPALDVTVVVVHRYDIGGSSVLMTHDVRSTGLTPPAAEVVPSAPPPPTEATRVDDVAVAPVPVAVTWAEPVPVEPVPVEPVPVAPVEEQVDDLFPSDPFGADPDADRKFAEAFSLPPAGWYPDPLKRFELRWWAGMEWTDRVRDGEKVLVDDTD